MINTRLLAFKKNGMEFNDHKCILAFVWFSVTKKGGRKFWQGSLVH